MPEPIEKITDSGIIFSIQEIKEMGFKKNHEYKVDDLPGAVSAYFGFIKNDLGDPEDYEIRFYNNHSDAIELGIKYTDNVTGENGCISKDCALWEEGLKHRIRMSDLGTLHPKYMSYIVYNNFILMCPGYDEGEALSKCTSIINKLTK
ncbi:MAG: hypothetical protein CL906_00020 [Dehalococcoidia bacterium]|nr:hypothetical protein [Dehalococcoidia bacterium]